MEQKKLKTLFESIRPELEAKLSSMTFTKDSVKIQETIVEYLNRLLDKEGEFRQNLTMSEDYVLQAAISLLNAQQAMALEFISNTHTTYENKPTKPKVSMSEQQKGKGLKREQYPIALGGTALGSAAGAIALGTWGAVFGAIAGTAIALYYASTSSQQSSEPVPIQDITHSQEVDSTIDVSVFLEIVGRICESVDTLIGTFRAQIDRVVDKYESQEKPTLESDYQGLLENVQALLGAYAMETTNMNRQKRIEQRIELLAEGLDNYDLQSVNYDGSNKNLFNFQPSANVSEDTMVLPAIVKNDKVILKGKVFVKE